MLEELIQKLQNEHGISAEQSGAVLNTVANFIKEKFPMIGSSLDSLLHSNASLPSAGATAPSPTPAEAGGIMNQVEDFAKKQIDGSARRATLDFLSGPAPSITVIYFFLV